MTVKLFINTQYIRTVCLPYCICVWHCL